jgi:hypothetical protein
MSSLGELWDSLRRVGLEALAPNLVRHSVTSINQQVLRAEELHEAGLLCWPSKPFWFLLLRWQLAQRKSSPSPQVPVRSMANLQAWRLPNPTRSRSLCRPLTGMSWRGPL